MAAIKQLEQLEKAYEFFNESEYPFLKEFKQHAITKRPYDNLKIIHNTHITLTTLCKIATLLYTGAEVTVTVTRDLIRHKDAMDLLLKSGIHFVEENEIKDDYDIVLDCCAGLYGKVNPRLGAVELTQTGSIIYKKNILSYPVVSVDDSITKNIENFYGTGDGFLRAFQELVPEDLTAKSFILFGYGKVGKGVAHHLKRFTQNILIIEKGPEHLKEALANGFKGIYYDDIATLSGALKDAFCVVTATGVDDLISRLYEKNIFKNVKYFANIGSHDEFGKLFSEDEVLFKKRPINFSLKEPTRFKFLDPIFYLHNIAAETLLTNKHKPGVYSYPIHQDLAIIGQWSKIHKIDTTQVLQTKSYVSPSILENLLRYLPCYVYWKDKYSKYMGCNHLFARAAGLASPYDIIGKTDFDLAWKETEATLFQASDREVLEGEFKINFIETQYQADGATKTVLASKVPLFQETGEIEGVMGIYVDITAEKQAEQLRLENETHKAKLEAQEAFTKIAAQVAHDIKSPVASLQMLLKSCQDIAEKERIALREATMRIQDIANNLLNHYSKNKNDSADSVKQEVLLASTLLLELLAEKKLQYQELPVKFEDQISQTGYFAFIQIETSGFKRMLSNIINNSIEAFEGKEGRIKLKLDADQTNIKISIQDNGKGMRPELVNKIKNNIAITEGKEQGHGIGLTQVRETLQKNQGQFEIESEVGFGTKITLTFPRISAPLWIAEDIRLNKDDTIIVLDDDNSIHGAWDAHFEVTLKKMPDIHLKHFTCGQEALDFINSSSPAEKQKIFLLSDYELLKQKLNGLDVIEKSGIKRSILVTSHYANPAIRERAEKIGTKILPKLLASEMPIVLEQSDGGSQSNHVEIVAIDDDYTFLKLLTYHFLSKDRTIEGFYNPHHFLSRLEEFPKDTKICFDYDFKIPDLDGLTLAKKLHEAGYTKLYMLSGMNFKQSDMPTYLTLIPKDKAVDLLDMV